MEESKLKQIIIETNQNLNSLLDMEHIVVAENYTLKTRANDLTTHLCGIVKLHTYLQIYNQDYKNPEMIKMEKQVKKTLDKIQNHFIKRTAYLLEMEEALKTH